MKWLFILVVVCISIFASDNQTQFPLWGDNETIFLAMGDNETEFYFSAFLNPTPIRTPTPLSGNALGGGTVFQDTPATVALLDAFKKLYEITLRWLYLCIAIILFLIAIIVYKYLEKRKHKQLNKDFKVVGVDYDKGDSQ